MAANRIAAQTWADLVVLALLVLLGLAGFATSYEDLGFLLAGVGGLIVGLGAAVGTHLLRLPLLPSILGGIVAYFLLGTAFAMPQHGIAVVIPNLQTLSGLAVGAVYGWADIVTLAAPAGAPDYINVLPYVATWAVATTSATMLLRWIGRGHRNAGTLLLALLGPLALYVASVLIGTDEPFLAIARGAGFGALALLWLGWRQRGSATIDSAQRTLNRKKLAGSAIVIVAALVVGGLGGVLVAPSQEQRFVLREEIQPPFDPQRFPSPLSGYRKYTKDLTETELFRIEGLQSGDLVRLASMDSYNGRLWQVSSPGPQTPEAAGTFRLVGRSIPDPTLLTTAAVESVTVEVLEYDDVWLPQVGYASGIQLLDEASAAESDALRFNSETGTAVLTSGADEGTSYRIDTRIQERPEPTELAGVPVEGFARSSIDGTADLLVARGREYASSSATSDPIDQLRAVETGFKANGFLSHGLASDAVPSRAGHGADRMTLLVEQAFMVGDEEQYASAMALIANDLGYPARVVMGFAPEVPEGGGEVVVTGDDVTAWVEVPFEGVGWVPFFPTPDETDVPQDQEPKPQSEPQPQVRQPPPDESANEDLLTPVDIDDAEDEDKDDGFVLPPWLVTLLTILAIPVLLYTIPLLVVLLLKHLRRRRRRSGSGDRQAAGAWEELVDRYAELGYPSPTGRTRAATALLLEQKSEAPLSAIATRTDDAVFSGREVPVEESDEIWTEAEAAVGLARASTSRLRRELAKFRIRLRRDLAGAGRRALERMDGKGDERRRGSS